MARKKKQEKNKVVVHIPVFRRDVLVIFGNEDDTRRVLSEYCEEEEINELLEDFSFDTDGHMVYSEKFKFPFVWMPEKPKTAEETGTLVHELFHASYAIFQSIGNPLTPQSEEVFAYTLGYLTEKVKEWLIPSSSCKINCKINTKKQIKDESKD